MGAVLEGDAEAGVLGNGRGPAPELDGVGVLLVEGGVARRPAVGGDDRGAEELCDFDDAAESRQGVGQLGVVLAPQHGERRDAVAVEELASVPALGVSGGLGMECAAAPAGGDLDAVEALVGGEGDALGAEVGNEAQSHGVLPFVC